MIHGRRRVVAGEVGAGCAAAGGAPDGRPPRLVVAHQPTWGLDVGAVAAVQRQLLDVRDAGAAVLLISDDLDEVMALGDRVAVMHPGHLTPARPLAGWTRGDVEEAIDALAAGGRLRVRARGPWKGRLDLGRGDPTRGSTAS